MAAACPAPRWGHTPPRTGHCLPRGARASVPLMKTGVVALLLVPACGGGPQFIRTDAAAMGGPAGQDAAAVASDGAVAAPDTAPPDRTPASTPPPAAARAPDPRFLPTATGPCPELTDGMV